MLYPAFYALNCDPDRLDVLIEAKFQTLIVCIHICVVYNMDRMVPYMHCNPFNPMLMPCFKGILTSFLRNMGRIWVL